MKFIKIFNRNICTPIVKRKKGVPIQRKFVNSFLLWFFKSHHHALHTSPTIIITLTWYRFRILLTQPWETLSCLDITQGLTPAAAISTIFSLIWFGNGRPLMKTPPSWLTLPWPRKITYTLNKEFQSMFAYSSIDLCKVQNRYLVSFLVHDHIA